MVELLTDFIVFLGKQNTEVAREGLQATHPSHSEWPLPVTNEFLPLLGSYGFMLHLGVCLPGILWVHAMLRCVFVPSELPFVLQVVPGPGRPAAHLS